MFYFETVTESPAVLRNNIDIQLPFTQLPQSVDTKHSHHPKDPLHSLFIFITSWLHPLFNI